MIRASNIKLTHFMCITDTYLDFENNSISIFQGENAQGKSAIMEAISLCFKPDHKRSDRIGEYVQRHQNEPAHIVFNATISNQPIKFDLTINKKGCDREITYGVDDTGKPRIYVNSEATNLIKSLELDFYSDLIFSLQNKNDIADITPTERAAMLAKLFQYDYSEQLKKIDDSLEELKEKQKNNKSKIELYQSSIKAKEDLRSSYKEKDLPFSEEEYLNKEKEQEEIFEKISSINEIYEKITELNSKKSELESENKTILFSIETLKNKIIEHDKVKELIKDFNYDDKMSDLTNQINSVEKEIENINCSIKESDSRLSEATKSLIDNSAIESAKSTELKSIVKKISLGEKGICPECGQSTCSIDLKSLNDEKSKIENEIIFATNKSKESKDLIKKYNDEITNFNSEINKLNSNKNKLNSNIESIKFELNSLNKKEKDFNIELINKSIVDNENNIKINDDKISDILKELNDLSTKTSNGRSLNIKYQQLQTEIKLFNSVKNENKIIVDQINSINKELEQFNKDIDAIKLEEPEIVQQIDLYNTAKKIFSKELPNYLTVKTCTMLDTEINSFVQEIFPNLQLCLRKSKKGVEFFYIEDTTEDIHNLPDEELGNAKMASGYEKAVFAIAFKIALCKAYGLEFAALDEIDAAASDANSTKTFESIINNGVFNQIIFITHSADTVNTIKSVDSSIALYHVEKGVFTLDEE